MQCQCTGCERDAGGGQSVCRICLYYMGNGINNHAFHGVDPMAKKKASNVESNGVEESPAERFKRLAVKRVSKAIKAMRAIATLGNKRQYEYTTEQVNKIVDALTDEHEAIQRAFAGEKRNVESFVLD